MTLHFATTALAQATHECGNSSALLRLLQISSPAFPIGAYAYSHGLEQAVDRGWVHDEDSARRWILGVLSHAIGCVEVPALARLAPGWKKDDLDQVLFWMRVVGACRDTNELSEEDRRLGQALFQALADLGVPRADRFAADDDATHIGAFALAMAAFDVCLIAGIQAYLFSWAENQASCAARLVPLGQSTMQRVLSAALPVVPLIVAAGLALADDEIGATAPGLAIASAHHETQYSRLFRS